MGKGFLLPVKTVPCVSWLNRFIYLFIVILVSKILCKRDLRKNSGFKKKEKLVFPSLNFISALPVSVSTKKEAQAVFFLRCFFRCLTFLSHYSLIFTLISHSLCLNNFHPFSFFSFPQHLSFFLSDLLLVFPSFLSCFLYSNLIWSLKGWVLFFFLNLVYFLIMCLAHFFTLSSSVVEIQENEVVDIRGMITFFLWLSFRTTFCFPKSF